MGTGTLNSYTNTGITLSASGAYTSPFTVTATGTVNAGTFGVYSTLASAYLLNAGSITGGNYGVGLLEGGTVTNSGANALIHGGFYGVVFKNAAGTVTNDGTIKSSASAGVDLSAGVYLGSGGTVTNTESYSVIYGHLDGVHAVNAAADVINSGTILAAYRDAVYLRDGGNVTNICVNAVISGDACGVDDFGFPGTISNAGTIVGTGSGGVYMGDGPLTNSGRSALIRGGITGVGAGDGADIINTGTILSTSTESNIFKPTGVELYDGTVANTASYSFIFGGEFGVDVTGGAATIGNAGTIIGNTAVGVYLTHGGTITNTAAGALIDGAQSGVKAKLFPVTITNAGTITGASADGVYLQAGGAVTNTGAASVISAGIDGVLAKTAAKVANAGTITGATSTGIYLADGGTITNTAAAALIQGANYGVVTKAATATIGNAGNITGQVTGIQARAAADITNTGSIAGLARYGAGLQAGGTLANTAASSVLSGGEDGVFATGAAASITNAGSITGLSNAGVYLKDGGAVTNGGAIAGAVDAIYSAGGFTLNALAGAVFDGRVVDQAGGGVLNLAGNAAGTLEMGGSFSGFSAINFGAASWTLEGTTSELADGQTISGFTPGDTIDLSGFAATSASYAAGVGLVLSSGSYSYVLSLSGGGGVFSYYGDGEGGTDIGFGTHTLSTYTASGITLTADGQDLAPFTVTATGTVNSTGAYGVYSALASTYLLNAGSINPRGSSLGYVGVDLANGGTVANSGASAIIQGAHYGVFLISGGDIANTGTILGMFDVNSDGVFTNGGTVTNSGRSAVIVGLDRGVLAFNGADILNSGTIMSADSVFEIVKPVGVQLDEGNVANTQSYSLIFGGVFGVIAGGAATISNAGTITGALGTGVWLRDGGSVTNTESGARIDGAKDGVDTKRFAATILNAGTITGTESDGVYLQAGGAVTNTGTAAFISGGINGVYGRTTATVANAGTITGTGSHGVYLGAGGIVTNTGTAAVISGGTDGVLDKATARVANAGTITGAGLNGIYLQTGGSVTNTAASARIAGGTNGVITHAFATVSNAGTITGTALNGVYLQAGGILTNTGTGAVIAGGSFGILAHAAAATIVNAGTISGGNAGIYVNGGGTVVNGGTIGGGSYAVRFHGDDANLLLVDPKAVFIGQVAAAGAGSTLELAAGGGGLAGLGMSFTGFDQIAFDPGAAWSLSGTELGFSNVSITGITQADRLDLTDLDFVGAARLTLGPADVLAVTQGSAVQDLTFSSGDIGGSFSVTSDGNGGTIIEEMTCFLRGTRIETARGQVAVEDLVIGEAVRTRHAGEQRIKWIGTRSYAARFAGHPKVRPVHIRAHAIADGVPSRDLFVSPGHAICIDDALIHAGRLVNGITITQPAATGEVAYYHIELETHEVILAENCPAETFMGEYFRGQFQNAEGFCALYPGDRAPEISALPALRQGFQLAGIVRRLRARAGIKVPEDPGGLRGHVDVCTPRVVSGWAQNEAAPDEPVILDILCHGGLIGRVMANIPRPDVAAAGFGAGNNGFEFALPPDADGPITLRRTADRAMLRLATIARAA